MFHDWNGNGRSDDAFDDYMEYRMWEEGTKHQGSGGGTGDGPTGTGGGPGSGGGGGGASGDLFHFHLIQNTIHIDVESTHDSFFLPKSVQSCNG